MAERPTRILLADDEQSILTLLSYPAAPGRLRRRSRLERRRGARALRRERVRPRRARRDDAERRRPRGLPAHARVEHGADHHADRQDGGDRQGPRPRARRRRLHHQAVLDPRVPQPRQGGAAALLDAPARLERRRRGADRTARGRRAAPGLRQAHAADSRRGRPHDVRRVRDRRRARPPPRPRVHTGGAARADLGDSAYRDPRTIDVHIRHLREKIERDPKEPDYIFTVRGVGYRFRDRDGK